MVSGSGGGSGLRGWTAPDQWDEPPAEDAPTPARGQRVLVIPDGAAEAPGNIPTTLESVRPLGINALARRGAVGRVAVTPEGLHAGSETGLPLLLGWTPTGPVSRGRIDAAAYGVPAPDDAIVHRVDLRHADGRPWPELAEAAHTLLVAASRRVADDTMVHALAGHRLLTVGSREPQLPADDELAAAGAARGVVGADDPDDRPYFKLWPDGATPPPILDDQTVVVCAARSTMAGVARLMGAETVHPSGATGRPETDVAAKARAATALLRDGVATVVVHVGSPDEAGHDHDPQAKRLEIQRIDRDLVAPLAALILDLGATIAVCPDHGTDPRTGRHTAGPVPGVLWGPGVPRSGPEQLTETAVAGEPAVASPWLLGTA